MGRIRGGGARPRPHGGGVGVAAERLAVDARSVVLFTKPTSVIKPDYTWKTTDRWIAFPWSDKPPVTEG